MSTEEVDVLVIGAGLAGLACAFELAEAGRDVLVLVLEAQDHVGGRTASWLEDVPDGGPSRVIGMAPVHKPLRTIGGLLGNNDLLSPAEKGALALFFANGLRAYVSDPAAWTGRP